MLEVEVHTGLLAYLRQGKHQIVWQHHLTMARLVGRALRLGRSAIIQTGTNASVYCPSYLVNALLWQGPVILLAPPTQQSLIRQLIPELLAVIESPPRQIIWQLPTDDFTGLAIATPQAWLAARFSGRHWQNVPTLIDGCDDLASWAQQQLTVDWSAANWADLSQIYPHQVETIQELRIKLTQSVFQHPPNPYNCYGFTSEDSHLLQALGRYCPAFACADRFFWARADHQQGHMTLHAAPVDLAPILAPLWQRQPLVLIGQAMDLDVQASVYRQNLGLGEITCIKLTPQRSLIRLYIPDGLPLPNTPQFQGAIAPQIYQLLEHYSFSNCVIITSDLPLKYQLGTIIAAKFGSRTQVESLPRGDRPILVTGWQFWRENQHQFPQPQLLIIPTIPLPSLENPTVAARVAHYKKQRRDWFRLYLLPEAVRELHMAATVLRQNQGTVAVLDSRINSRSYGQQILMALSPFARTNYLDDLDEPSGEMGFASL